MAYGEVLNVKSGMISISMEEYENPDKIKTSGQWNEMTAAAAGIYETIGTSKQPTMEHASTDVSVCQ